MYNLYKFDRLQLLDFEIIHFKLQETLASKGELYVITRQDEDTSEGRHYTLGLKGHTTTGVNFSCIPHFHHNDDDEILYEDDDWKVDGWDEDEDENSIAIPAEGEDLDYLDVTLMIPEYACREDLEVGIQLMRIISTLYPECEISTAVRPQDDDCRKMNTVSIDPFLISVEKEYEANSFALYINTISRVNTSLDSAYNGYKTVELSSNALDLKSDDPKEVVKPLWKCLIDISSLDTTAIYFSPDEEHILPGTDTSIACPDFYNHADTLIQSPESFICLNCGKKRRLVRNDVLRRILKDRLVYPTTCHDYIIIPKMSENEYKTLFDMCPGIELDEIRIFLLRWNPKISDFKMKNFLRMLTQQELGSYLKWAVTDWQEMRKGDYALLSVVGTDYDGIVAGGKIGKCPIKGRDWKNQSRQRNYAEIELEMMMKPDSEFAISADRLKEIAPDVDWHRGHSGILLPPDSGCRLRGLWQQIQNGHRMSEISYVSDDISLTDYPL